MWGPGSDGEPNCNPINVEIFRVNDRLLEGWTPPRPASYRGASDLRHGLRSPAARPPLNEALLA